MPTYTGTAGSDSFTAPTNEDWTISGLGGGDILAGAGGNDVFVGGSGADILDGADGDDSFLVGRTDGVDTFYGGTGFDQILATGDNMKIGIRAFSGIELISANGHANVGIIGTADDNVFDFSATTLTGIVTIFGGAGADTIIGSANADRINGGGGDDTLSGGNGDDIFFVSDKGGVDAINGGVGYDIVQATANNVHIGLSSYIGIEEISAGGFAGVTIRGTEGDDILDFSAIKLTGITAINGVDGNDTIIGTAFDDTLIGGNGTDTLRGGLGNDILDGGLGNDQLEGGAGDDTFIASGGLDTFKGGAGYDIVTANHDNAVITITSGLFLSIEEISAGGFSNVVLAGTGGDDVINLSNFVIADGDFAEIRGGAGNDVITGSKVADMISGGDGNDMINGGVGDDVINGGGGNDTLVGSYGADMIYGGTGADVIDGGRGNDMLDGGGGDDIFLFNAQNGFDSIDGGDGFDTVQAAASNVAIIGLTSFANIEAISSGGFASVTIAGAGGDDHFDFSHTTLTGIKQIALADGNDSAIGSSGDDILLGQGGNDTIDGGAGNDTISGGTGLDVLTGGAGADIFRDPAASLAGDTITDFGAGDRIEITNYGNSAAITFSYAGDLLTIDPDGAGKAKGIAIHVAGDFTADSFHAISNGAGGSYVELFGI